MIKPQYVDQKDEVCKVLDLLKVKDRDVKDLSGGELQRIACAMVCIAGRGHIYVRRALVLPRRCDRHLRAHPRARQVRDCRGAQSLRARLSLRCPYSVVTMPFSLREGIREDAPVQGGRSYLQCVGERDRGGGQENDQVSDIFNNKINVRPSVYIQYTYNYIIYIQGKFVYIIYTEVVCLHLYFVYII